MNTIPAELIVFFASMMPITELQGGISLGILKYDMNPWTAFFWGTAGAITISLVLLTCLERVTEFLIKNSKFCQKILNKLFEKTRAKHEKSISELGHIALLGYIAIPTPGSGAWTGALIVYLFGIPRKTAILILSLGLIITGLIVTFGVEGILQILSFY